MKALIYFLSAFCTTGVAAPGQGIFIYDQQSVTEPYQGEFGYYDIQTSQPLGQSFTPTLSSVSFVRLLLLGPNSGSAANVYVDLWADSIGGTLLGSTDPVDIPVNFGSAYQSGYIDFFFSSPVNVTPGSMYYFQPVLESGSNDASVGVAQANYPGGEIVYQGISSSTESPTLMFGEGIYVVPEPSSLWLALLGGGIWFYARRAYIKHRSA